MHVGAESDQRVLSMHVLVNDSLPVLREWPFSQL